MAYYLDAKDTELVEKLELVGAVTNEAVLSDEEIFQGRAFISRARDALLRLDCRTIATGERSRLSEHISKLSIAVAPHKRIPVEILCQVFLHLFPKPYNHDFRLSTKPMVRSESPWIVGQVCGAWRRVSRFMPELWGVTHVKLDDKHSDPTVVRRLVEILREFSKLYLNFTITSLEFIKLALLPYLFRVDTLDWRMDDKLAEDLLHLFPSQRAIPFLHSSLHLVSSHGNSSELFSQASHLRELSLYLGKTFLPLFINFPWNQLDKLTIHWDPSLQVPLQFQMAVSSWSPFNCASCLRNLALDAAMLGIETDLNIPWHQLLEFTVLRDASSVFDALVRTVNKCTALEHLDFEIREPQAITLLHHQINIHALLSFRISQFEAYRVPFEDVCLILTQFRQLERFFCFVSPPAHATIWDSIVLPHLHTFRYAAYESATPCLFPILTTPALRDLTIQMRHGPDLLQLSQYIARSQCELISFSMMPFACLENQQLEFSEPGLKELLSMLKDCNRVMVANSSMTQELLDDIAAGLLLPCVEELRFRTSTFDAFIDFIRCRLEVEGWLDQSRLYHVAGFVFKEPNAQQLELVQSLESNPKFRVDYFCG